jgi:hypothetical protein
MKKILYVFTLVLLITIISAYNHSGQNGIAEKYAIPDISEDLKVINKAYLGESETIRESLAQKKSADTPRILHLISNEKGKAAWSNSLWWSYKQNNKEQPGC